MNKRSLGLPEEYAKYIPVAEGNMNQAEVANLIKSNKAKGDLKQVLKGPLRPRVGKNDLKRNDPRRQPQNFEEQYRAGNWRFREFREKGEVGLHTTEFGINRTKWERIPFPMVGDADPRTSKWGQGRPQQYVRPRRQPNRLLDDSPGDERLERVRRRFRSANRFFQKKGKMEMVRPLGWGGLGLTIQYRYTNIEPAMNLVLKIALEGWDDQSLQAEEEMTRQVSRAAHCIQAIPPEKIGMRPKEPFRFKALNFADSSDEGKSSGEESRGEEPKKKRKTRRQMILEDTQQMRIKRQAQQDRAVRWQHRWDERKRRLEAREKRWAAQAAKGQPRTRNDREDREWQLDNRDFLLLEFAEHGDLANFIYKCNELNEMVPNRVLWSFWLCLVSACVAMEYPPRKFHPLRHDPNPPETKGLPTMGFTNFNGENRGKRLGNDLFEDVPHPSRRWAGRGQVHFDIDPQNVLIFGTDPTTLDDEHKTIPRLKLTDFGVASRIKRNKSNLYYWCQRSTGKTDYLAPEQFGPDWEHVAVRTRSGPEISEQPVAGNYGSHTNVWGIALTLWQLMTRLCVPFPPQPSSDPKEPVSYCRVINSRADLAYIDQDLKNTINQCMMHRPGDRPSLLTLMNQAKEGITRRYEGESDRRISAWVSRILNDAPTS
ncbi:kinase-like protein [Camillea tinctor]|nr:kinase-like protein [Camillea tinctor]